MEPLQNVPNSVHPATLQEKPPEIIANLYDQGITLLSENGWYLIFAALVCAMLWPKARVQLDKWQKERDRQLEDAKRKKNPELYETRQLAMEVARLRMQEEQNKHAKLAAERAAEKEEQKRLELLSRLGPDAGGNKLDSAANTTPRRERTEPIGRPQYNPLMGGGTSGGYRPSRRSCPGGGCG